MSIQPLAQHEFQALLGHAAIDDTLWQDVHRFISTTLVVADEVWQLRQRDDVALRTMTYHRDEVERAEFARQCGEIVQQLWLMLGREAAARSAAAVLLHPQCWQPAYDGAYQSFYRRQALALLVRSVAEHCVALQPPRDWLQRLGQRLHDLGSVARLNDAASFLSCIDALLSSAATATEPRVAALLDALTVGDWNEAWQAIRSLAGRSQDGVATHIGLVWEQVLAWDGAQALGPATPAERIRDYSAMAGMQGTMTLSLGLPAR